jgi:hypothetical protein
MRGYPRTWGPGGGIIAISDNGVPITQLPKMLSVMGDLIRGHTLDDEPELDKWLRELIAQMDEKTVANLRDIAGPTTRKPSKSKNKTQRV